MRVSTLHLLALFFYVTAAVVLAGSLVGGRRNAPRWGGAVVAAGVVCHATALGVYTLTFGQMPLVGLAPSLSFLAFLIGAFLLAALAFRDVHPLGLVLV